MIIYRNVDKWGDSLGLRIPAPIAEHLKIERKSAIKMEVKGEKLIIQLSEGGRE